MLRTGKRVLVSALIVLAVALLAAEAVSVKDSTGTQINLPAKAVRIVSLAPAITEAVYAAGASVIGNTTYCNYPEAAKAVSKIGGYYAKAVNIEAIAQLKPDLVIGELSAHESLKPALDKAGIKLMLVKLDTFEDIYAAIALIGQVTGNTKITAALTSAMKNRMKAVADKIRTIPDAKRPALFWEVWHEPLMTAGPNTFIGQIIAAAGAKNVFSDIKEDWPVISFETVLAKNPDFIGSTFSHGAEMDNTKLAQRTGWSAMKAVANKRVLLFDDDIFSRPGPRFVDAVEMLAKALYPELFK